jgi:hypothetical protein
MLLVLMKISSSLAKKIIEPNQVLKVQDYSF